MQDFQTCPRRFKLRYLEKLRWPAIESEPIQESERLARLGREFHRLVNQHLVGVEADILTAYLQNGDAALQTWWQHYLDYRPASLATAQLYPELALSTPLRGYRLAAQLDLLVIQPDGTHLIIDWKTARRKPSREQLARHIQTRVYPYVLASTGGALGQKAHVDPASVQMMYWYTHFPDEPELFEYSEALFRRDEQFLSDLIEQVKHSHFPLVASEKPCVHCVYRSYCERGAKAGALAEIVEEVEAEESLDVLSLDWEQIAEIQF